MKITLHLGAHHTGGQALALACHENADRFRATNTSVWMREDARVAEMMKAMRRPNAAAADVQHRAQQLVTMHLQDEVSAGTTELIIDAPNVLGTRQDSLRNTKLYPFAQTRLARLIPIFEGHTVQLSVAIRSYETYWSSILFEAVSNGAMQADPALLPINVWTYEGCGNRPETVIAPLYMHDDHDPLKRSSELTDLLRGEPTWNTFESHQTEAMRAQYLDDLTWLDAQPASQVCYIQPKRQDRLEHAERVNPAVITPRRVTPSRGHTNDQQKRSMG